MKNYFSDCHTDAELEQRLDQIVQQYDAITERNSRRLDEISEEFIRSHSVIPSQEFTNFPFEQLNAQVEAQRRQGAVVFGIIQISLIVAAILVILALLY